MMRLPTTRFLAMTIPSVKRTYRQLTQVRKLAARPKYHLKSYDEEPDEHKCHDCGQTFTFKSSLFFHMREAEKLALSCVRCDVRFCTTLQYKQHFSEQHKPKYRCELCYIAFDTREGLAYHKRDIKKKSFFCVECNQNFCYAHSLKQHEIKVHTKNKAHLHLCLDCGDYYESSSQLSVHKKNREAATYHCKLCETSFCTKFQLGRHFCDQQEDPPLPVERNFRCNRCGNNFSSESSLGNHHRSSFHSECEICGAQFCNEAQHSRHMREEHGEVYEKKVQLSEKEKDTLTCDDCGRVFYSICKLKVHKTKMLKYDLVCKETGKQFCTKKDLKSHNQKLEIVTLEDKVKEEWCPEFVCPDCDGFFTSKGGLRLHQEKARAAEIFCEECDKQLCHKKHEQWHKLREHNFFKYKPDEKIYGCPVCDYANYNSENYLKHLNIHLKQMNQI